MAYYFNGIKLEPGIGFTHDGIKYPGNWVELATDSEKASVGITYEKDIAYDDRFFSLDEHGDVQLKPVSALKGFWVGQVKKKARQNLEVSDWYITRQVETGIPAPQQVLDHRAEIRAFSNTKEAAINAITTTEELAAYVTSQDYASWPTMEPIAS